MKRALSSTVAVLASLSPLAAQQLRSGQASPPAVSQSPQAAKEAHWQQLRQQGSLFDALLQALKITIPGSRASDIGLYLARDRLNDLITQHYAHSDVRALVDNPLPITGTIDRLRYTEVLLDAVGSASAPSPSVAARSIGSNIAYQFGVNDRCRSPAPFICNVVGMQQGDIPAPGQSFEVECNEFAGVNRNGSVAGGDVILGVCQPISGYGYRYTLHWAGRLTPRLRTRFRTQVEVRNGSTITIYTGRRFANPCMPCRN